MHKLNVWKALHNGLKTVLFSKESKELGELREQRTLLRQSLKQKTDELQICNNGNKQLSKDVDQLKLQLADQEVANIIPEEYQAIAEKLDTQFPKAKVLHALPILLKDSQVVNKNVEVQNFVQDFYELHNKVKKMGFTLEAYKEKYPKYNWGELVNKLAFDIYKHTRRYVTYKYDINKYGFSEYWQISILTHYLGQGDCEDSTNYLLSWFKAAGLPAFAFRNTCGGTKLGGHSTTYAYDFKNKVWKHMEATTQTTRGLKDFYSLPDKNKPHQLHITDVWWSFNWEFAWHKFETAAAKKTMPERFTITK